ncbi:MAG: ribbon-helix-helix protein, CopG family [Candidatus Verstraetearchaeota archaeon]|jgi:CopG family nickel-responsive transcriptional regulator|nr:ribbon-helix-helix protein, CopG family [Candidatus Verstraetearchaeota archaeon]
MIISISLPDDLLEELDKILSKEWYVSRSEALRHAIRKYIYEYKDLEKIEGEVIATLTILYEKFSEEDIRHKFMDIIVAFIHVHINNNKCLEVMVVKGNAEKLRKMISELKARKNIENIGVSIIYREI